MSRFATFAKRSNSYFRSRQPSADDPDTHWTGNGVHLNVVYKDLMEVNEVLITSDKQFGKQSANIAWLNQCLVIVTANNIRNIWCLMNEPLKKYKCISLMWMMALFNWWNMFLQFSKKERLLVINSIEVFYVSLFHLGWCVLTLSDWSNSVPETCQRPDLRTTSQTRGPWIF